MITQAMITTTVPWITWFWPGHSTLRSSPIDSRMKLPRRQRQSRAGWPGAASARARAASGTARRSPRRRAAPAPLPLARHRRARAPRAARAAPALVWSGHDHRVSRCGVCWPHQRQYFLSSTRSGVFRFDFIDS